MKYVLPENEALRTKEALMRPANETLNAVQRLLRGCKDADVTFVPVDLLAHAGTPVLKRALPPLVVTLVVVVLWRVRMRRRRSR